MSNISTETKVQPSPELGGKILWSKIGINAVAAAAICKTTDCKATGPNQSAEIARPMTFPFAETD